MAPQELVPDDTPQRRDTWSARHPIVGQTARYIIVGAAGTVLNAAIFLILRQWWPVVLSNVVAVVSSTVLSTEATRRYSFKKAESRGWRNQIQTLGTIVFYLGYTSVVLFTLSIVVSRTTPLLESLTVAAASILGGTVRFLIIRYWALTGVRRSKKQSETDASHDR